MPLMLIGCAFCTSACAPSSANTGAEIASNPPTKQATPPNLKTESNRNEIANIQAPPSLEYARATRAVPLHCRCSAFTTAAPNQSRRTSKIV
jgi:hypothetical protein